MSTRLPRVDRQGGAAPLNPRDICQQKKAGFRIRVSSVRKYPRRRLAGAAGAEMEGAAKSDMTRAALPEQRTAVSSPVRTRRP